MNAPVLFAQHDGVLHITLNRPTKKNALTATMYQDIQRAMEQAISDDSVRVILFSGTGDFFSAGNDLQDFLHSTQTQNEDLAAFHFVSLLGSYPKPIVAAVTGSGVGIGLTLLLHCDLVYITQNATLSAPFVNLALVPEAGSSLLLTERIGYNRAFALFALGESLSAAEAVTLGIANASYPTAQQTLAAAQQKAALLAQKPAEALLKTKQLMRKTALK